MIEQLEEVAVHSSQSSEKEPGAKRRAKQSGLNEAPRNPAGGSRRFHSWNDPELSLRRPFVDLAREMFGKGGGYVQTLRRGRRTLVGPLRGDRTIRGDHAKLNQPSNVAAGKAEILQHLVIVHRRFFRETMPAHEQPSAV
jgi:hypothetical protein